VTIGNEEPDFEPIVSPLETSVLGSHLLGTQSLINGIIQSSGIGRVNTIVNAALASQMRASIQPVISVLDTGFVSKRIAGPLSTLAMDSLFSTPSFRLPSFSLPTFMNPSFNIKSTLLANSINGGLLSSNFFAFEKSLFANALGGFDFKALLARWYPRNWPRDIDLELVRGVAMDGGIPVTWVTPAAVIEKLVRTDNLDERLAILLDNRDQILETCGLVLDEIEAEELHDAAELARQALVSLSAGTFGPAQAMSVAILDSLSPSLDVNLNSEPAVRKKYVFHSDDLIIQEMVYYYTMAPLIPFARPWHPSSLLPKPITLSRHVTIHQTDLEHYNPTNALVAVMLVTSVLRTCAELIGESSGR
jgi:hypothetical protein